MEHEGETIPIPYKYVSGFFAEDGNTLASICETCNGAGDIPNPEGPERFDLLHTDGYALRHRWL